MNKREIKEFKNSFYFGKDVKKLDVKKHKIFINRNKNLAIHDKVSHRVVTTELDIKKVVKAIVSAKVYKTLKQDRVLFEINLGEVFVYWNMFNKYSLSDIVNKSPEIQSITLDGAYTKIIIEVM
jgi:uncharacterized protein YbbC (DUF1343 family)